MTSYRDTHHGKTRSPRFAGSLGVNEALSSVVLGLRIVYRIHLMPPRRDFDRHLKSEDLLPVYALIGTETVLVREAVQILRSRALTQAPDFNRDEFRAVETPIEQVLQAAGTLPMMAPCRWVLLEDVHKLRAKENEPLLAYLTSPSPTTVLCLAGEKLDLRRKLGQQLNKGKHLFGFEPPKQRELPGWIRGRAEQRGYEIEPAAAHLLADVIGTDLGGIDMALEKLWTHTGGAGKITHDDVEAVVAPTRVHSIFELTDAIGSRDLGRASLLLRNTIDGGESGLRVLAMVTRQLRQLLRIKSLGTASPSQIAREVGVPPFLVDSLKRQAARYEEGEIATALYAASRADLRMKSTRLAHGVVLDRFLVEMMTPQHP